jgi:dephospho-CoA kinase
LLGGIGAGKSHVARLISRLGPGTVVDADELARATLLDCARDGRLQAALGSEFVLEAGTSSARPDRAAIARKVFTNPGALRALERLTHPGIESRIVEHVHAHRQGGDAPVLVLDVPLLIEVGLDRRCDALWFVEVPEALRLERAAKNGFAPDEVARRETHQAPLDRKRARADLIIRNDVTDAELERQVREGLQALGVWPAAASPGAPPLGAAQRAP